MQTEEERFFEKLKDVFIGEEVEGESGYINLMKIKSKYFDKIFKILKKEIDEKTKEFPEFKKELYDKLYDFFKRYFSESGSIYFRHTPFKERIFERVYSDNKDVVMFWKTNMLYYVKTDILPKSMEVSINGVKFYFDVSKLQHKKAWEKRKLIYEFKEVKNNKIVFYVYYSERGRKTNTKEILKKLKGLGINLDEDTLERAFRVFEKQSEVDYFINKNARKFLKEQFDLWLYQYVYSDETQFTSKRIKQLKVLKEIAYKIIDFISQFEDELVKIWQKPKFVLNSNYVITLDRIAKKKDGIKVIEKILKHPNFKKQVKEWEELGIVDKNFNPKNILTNSLKGKTLNKKFQFLPIDTKYFKDLELEILSLFDELDKELDGWLIKSENWQALNTILPKFKGKVQLIYIDPPFNTGSNEFTMYINRFLDSAWITMMENRLRLAKEFLKDTGSIYVRIDYHGNHYVRFLMDDIFGKENFRNEIDIKRNQGLPKTGDKNLIEETENLLVYSKSDAFRFKSIRLNIKPKWVNLGTRPSPKENNAPIIIDGKKFYPPKFRRWIQSQENIEKLYKEGKVKIENNKIKILLDKKTIGTNWTDIPGYSVVPMWGFSTENHEKLLKRVIESSSEKSDIILDFFLGIGTTTSVAHKLRRKWIGIEMGSHFYQFIDKRRGLLSGVLIRMKEVLAGKGNHEPYGISKEVRWKGGGFFKYYELEQYEDTLRRVKYSEENGFFDMTQDPYNQYIFMKDIKLLESLEIDYRNNKVKVNLEKLYKNIDIAETLSNVFGKWIKRIGKDFVEFEDGERVNLKDLDYKLVKSLIWW